MVRCGRWSVARGVPCAARGVARPSRGGWSTCGQRCGLMAAEDRLQERLSGRVPVCRRFVAGPTVRWAPALPEVSLSRELERCRFRASASWVCAAVLFGEHHRCASRRPGWCSLEGLWASRSSTRCAGRAVMRTVRRARSPSRCEPVRRRRTVMCGRAVAGCEHAHGTCGASIFRGVYLCVSGHPCVCTATCFVLARRHPAAAHRARRPVAAMRMSPRCCAHRARPTTGLRGCVPRA